MPAHGGSSPVDVRPDSRLRSGQVAELAGVNIQTLRYYERRGLIAEPDRSPGGHRAYPADTVTLVAVIKAAQRLGFTLTEISELLATGRRRHASKDLQAQAQRKVAEIDQRIADLSTIRDVLRQVVAAQCDSLTECTCALGPPPFTELARAARASQPARPAQPAQPVPRARVSDKDTGP